MNCLIQVCHGVLLKSFHILSGRSRLSSVTCVGVTVGAGKEETVVENSMIKGDHVCFHPLLDLFC
jgi:hypothetical protein